MKSICIIFLVLLLNLRIDSAACICPVQAISPAASVIRSADLCQDCGHTKNCCFSQMDLELVGSDTPSQEGPITDLSDSDFSFVEDLNSNSLVSQCVSRAPPQIVYQTPVSLHQKLVI